MKLKTFGNLLIILSFSLILVIYGPLLFQETVFLKNRLFRIERTLDSPKVMTPRTKIIEPVSTEFGLVIPKIGVNSQVFKNIDPYDPQQYQSVLTRGVAHAQKSALPGQAGYIFIFAHSAGTPLDVIRYHAVFYLLNKLKQGDEIDLFYQKKRRNYEVLERKIVSAQEALSYINQESLENFLVLQTCYPPGTTLKRMIVIAREKTDSL